MTTLISRNNVTEHNVQSYSFKVIALGGGDEKEKVVESASTNENVHVKEESIDSSALSTSSKESLIESLMQKTDEMSSNFIKLQMKLEAKEEEFQEELKKVKEETFHEGLEAGKAKALEEIDTTLNSKIELFDTSVKKLEESADEFEKALEGVKNELINAALDIAKEVVQVELSEHSEEVAKTLGDALVKELQNASKITLKVNPKDHTAVVEHLGQLAHVKVVPDSAVNEGGVVVLSDVGNRDAQIEKRFQRVKKAALSE